MKTKIAPDKKQAAVSSPEAKRRMTALTAANRKLEREITRLKAAEARLEKGHERLLTERSKQMRDLSRRLLEEQEEDRRRISRELHDEVLQTLIGVNVHLQGLDREADLDLARFKRKLASAQNLIVDSVNAVHRFARELRPLMLDDLGLLPALRSHITDFCKRTSLRVNFKAFAGIELLSSARRTVLYRVVQSALSNIAEHAQARSVKVTIQDNAPTVLLTIHDDGKSFDVAYTLNSKRYNRLGLLGMRERVEMVGGDFSIVSSPGKGTTIRAEIPSGKVDDKRQPGKTARRGAGLG